MPHQVGQLPSLAAEQRAQAGSKIKHTAAALWSLELGGRMLYWLRNFTSKYHKQQEPGQRPVMPEYEILGGLHSGLKLAIMMSEHRLDKVSQEGKSEKLLLPVTFKQVHMGTEWETMV